MADEWPNSLPMPVNWDDVDPVALDQAVVRAVAAATAVGEVLGLDHTPKETT